MLTSKTSPRTRKPGFLARFARHKGGLAAVEMALIAPVMIFGYFGLTEVTMAMMAHRRASHAVATIGDLVTQSTQMNTATMTDIFTIGATMMRPFPSSPLQMRVTSVQMDATEKITVIWSKGSGGMAALGAGTAITDPKLKTMMKPWDSIIVTEMSYSYDSPFKQALPNALTFADKFYLRPRRSDQVLWSTS
jgi:Flp pilus assembly protein TadG